MKYTYNDIIEEEKYNGYRVVGTYFCSEKPYQSYYKLVNDSDIRQRVVKVFARELSDSPIYISYI